MFEVAVWVYIKISLRYLKHIGLKLFMVAAAWWRREDRGSKHKQGRWDWLEKKKICRWSHKKYMVWSEYGKKMFFYFLKTKQMRLVLEILWQWKFFEMSLMFLVLKIYRRRYGYKNYEDEIGLFLFNTGSVHTPDTLRPFVHPPLDALVTKWWFEFYRKQTDAYLKYDVMMLQALIIWDRDRVQ